LVRGTTPAAGRCGVLRVQRQLERQLCCVRTGGGGAGAGIAHRGGANLVCGDEQEQMSVKGSGVRVAQQGTVPHRLPLSHCCRERYNQPHIRLGLGIWAKVAG